MMLGEFFRDNLVMLKLKNDQVVLGKITEEEDEKIVLSNPKILLDNGMIIFSKRAIIMKREIVNAGGYLRR
ncbi:hypothetical protein B6U71_02380 [Euryarchaeota archaeon ex4484_178]|nr:MAG: hypothetical protein B6U71_02380 [Euryarchaeota archaeon ex4484_178]